MDRREMLKGAAMLPSAMIGLSVVDNHLVAEGGAFSIDARWQDRQRGVPEPKLYDPVSVLEAIRLRFRENPEAMLEVGPGGYFAGMYWPEHQGWDLSSKCPDFRSAVLWLHKQAAAVDAEFAKAWPVPE